MTQLTVAPKSPSPTLASLPTGALILCSNTLLQKLEPTSGCEKQPRFSVVAQHEDGAHYVFLRTVTPGDTVTVNTGASWDVVQSVEVRL